MRDDFAKQLTERERIGHSRSYADVRGLKAFKHVDQYFGGRESMKARHRLNYQTKSFNENLNPLKGWLHSCIGKQWDKCYGELRKKFDARKVVNAHILEHLFDYVEVNAYLKGGKVVFLQLYRYGGQDRELPIKQCRADYYVCPKDGTLKVTSKQPRRSIIKQRAAEKQAARDAIFRSIDKYNELHFVDGIWYLYTLKDRPAPVSVLHPPLTWTSIEDRAKWNSLSLTEKEKVGRRVTDYQDANELRPPNGAFARYGKLPPLYYASRQTASKKLLKEHGIGGTAVFDDSAKLSRRELSKYQDCLFNPHTGAPV